jgi:hypothetical protein
LNPSVDEDRYVTRKQLEDRGWKAKDIKELEFVAKTINPECPFGAMMNLYDRKEAERCERQSEFRYRKTDHARKAQGSLEWARKAQVNVTKNLCLNTMRGSLGEDLLSTVRHEFTNYLGLVREAREHYLGQTAVKIIRHRVLRAVLKNYSDTRLRNEAEQQWYRWYGEDFNAPLNLQDQEPH